MFCKQKSFRAAMIAIKLVYTTVVCLALALSCANDPQNKDNIQQYLTADKNNGQPYLKINHDGFNKDFFVYASFIPHLSAQSGYSLKGRVIQFVPRADRVLVMESAQGHSISDKNSSIFLAELPIISHKDDGIVVDFAQGMNNVFIMRNVNSEGVANKSNGTNEQFRSVVLTQSFLKDITVNDDVLVASQIAQWRSPKSELISAEFKYFFSHYHPSKTFKKKRFGRQRFVEYFSTPPMVSPSSTENVAFITKWDIKKKIRFYLSANTPKAYRQPIKDGLLFWNHIFQKDIIEVFDLEPGLNAPHPHKNIVQWVTWDNEPSAYADMVIDHLTGEVLKANIYVRSGWISQSIRKLNNQLEEFNKEQVENEKPNHANIALPVLFNAPDICVLTAEKSSTENSQIEFDESAKEFIAGDVLRAVIAHEMGHVLGLRHNLAGSLSSDLSVKKHQEIIKDYFKNPHEFRNLDHALTSSIMDVFSIPEDAIIGSQIRAFLKSRSSTDKFLALFLHDKEAIDYGYFDKPASTPIPFCSDDTQQLYLDCLKWDFSNEPLIFLANKLDNLTNQVAAALADTLVAGLNPKRPSGPLSLHNIPLSYKSVVMMVSETTEELYAWFKNATRSIKIEAQFPAYGPQNQEEITKSKFVFLTEQLNKNGLEPTLFALLPPFQDSILNEANFMAYFNSLFVKKAQALNKNSYVITENDINEANYIARQFFNKLKEIILDITLDRLAQAQFDDALLQEPLETALFNIAKDIIFNTKQSPYNESTLPQFTYRLETRDKAARILSPTLGVAKDWSFDNLELTIVGLKQIMQSIVKTNNNEINWSSMSRKERQWFLEQNQLLSTLLKMKTATRDRASGQQKK